MGFTRIPTPGFIRYFLNFGLNMPLSFVKLKDCLKLEGGMHLLKLATTVVLLEVQQTNGQLAVSLKLPEGAGGDSVYRGSMKAGDSVTIGREGFPEHLDDRRFISRQHLTLSVSQGENGPELFVADNNSSNGTFKFRV